MKKSEPASQTVPSRNSTQDTAAVVILSQRLTNRALLLIRSVMARRDKHGAPTCTLYEYLFEIAALTPDLDLLQVASQKKKKGSGWLLSVCGSPGTQKAAYEINGPDYAHLPSPPPFLTLGWTHTMVAWSLSSLSVGNGVPKKKHAPKKKSIMTD
jgi:hypothetical protein